jgi:hypothetical protein
MIDPLSIKQDLYALAVVVEPDDINAAWRLRGLGDAVEKPSGPYRAAWTSSDIHQMISADLIVEQYRERQFSQKSGLIGFLELLRNVFIFVPILITWYSISQATDQYNQYFNKLPDNQKTNVPPFLSLWLQGFNGNLPDWLKLSSVASIDALILLGIIILTFVVYFVVNVNRQRQEQAIMNLHTKIVHVLAGAILCLNNKQQPAYITPSDNLDAAARQIENMSQRIIVAFDSFEKRLTAQFNGITNQLTNQFSRIEQEMVKQLQQGSNYLNQLGGTAASVGQLTKDMKDAALLLKDANSELTHGIEGLVGPATDLSKQQQQLLGAVNQSLGLLQENARTMNALGDEQKNWGKELVEALDTLKIETQKSADMIAQFAQFTTQQDQFLSQLEDERGAQSKLAERMNFATQGMEEALRMIHGSTDALRQIAVDTNDLLRLYASLPRSMHKDMHEILNGYAGAAQQIEKGGRDLSESAISIVTASQYLEKVLTDLEKRFAHI